VWHPGTIWLGRLDETDYVLRAGTTGLATRDNSKYYLPAVCLSSSQLMWFGRPRMVPVVAHQLLQPMRDYFKPMVILHAHQCHLDAQLHAVTRKSCVCANFLKWLYFMRFSCRLDARVCTSSAAPQLFHTVA